MADASLRVLGPGDEAALRAFLAPHADSSLFLIANLAQAGIVDRDVPYAGAYAGRFEDGALTGVVAHYWNGNLIFQDARDPLALARLALEATNRPLKGLIGPWEQVLVVRTSPDASFAERTAQFESHDLLYALSIDELVVPAALGSGAVACRPAVASDVDLVARWRVGYRMELLNEGHSSALEASAREEMTRMIGEGTSFVLEAEGAPVAYSGFNARADKIVQIGGVWTPPELRGRGYGRCVVAGQLQIARAQGATRAVLFTSNENLPAQRAYEAIGFSRIGEYGLILFA